MCTIFANHCQQWQPPVVLQWTVRADVFGSYAMRFMDQWCFKVILSIPSGIILFSFTSVLNCDCIEQICTQCLTNRCAPLYCETSSGFDQKKRCSSWLHHVSLSKQYGKALLVNAVGWWKLSAVAGIFHCSEGIKASPGVCPHLSRTCTTMSKFGFAYDLFTILAFHVCKCLCMGLLVRRKG